MSRRTEPNPALAPLRHDACGAPLREGDTVVLVDPKGREYMRELHAGRRYSLHCGMVDVDAILGLPDASRVFTSLGQTVLVFRPTYARLVPHMPRAAQLIYPKDVSSILLWGDIYPGARVVETGVGPGALTLALLRAVGPTGSLVSIERREDHIAMARENVTRFHGEAPNWTVVLGDASAEVGLHRADRVILDLPEPEPVIAGAADALRPGGLLVVYVPTTLQLHSAGEALAREPRVADVRTFETLHRGWHVASNSVRPDHRMVAHTGFVMVALRLGVHEPQRPIASPVSTNESNDASSELENPAGDTASATPLSPATTTARPVDGDA